MYVYHIKEGDVREIANKCNSWPAELVKLNKDCNWQDECLVLSKSEEAALELANKYDKGLISYDNCFWPDSYGSVLVCLSNN